MVDQEIYAMAIYILHSTDDGDDLDLLDLKLIENGINGFLNDAGIDALRQLHDKVKKGYARPFLHGIEHLTIRQDGYVYWRGEIVEHYDFPFAYSEDGKKAALDLADRCRKLEALGIVPTTTTAIWNWEKYENLTSLNQDTLKELLDGV